MVFVASLLAYLVAVTGISASLLMLVCALLAPPGQSTLAQHGGAISARQSEPPPHKASLSTRLTASARRRPNSARAEGGIVSQTQDASYSRHRVHVAHAALPRQKSRAVASRDRLGEWAYRYGPNAFSSRRTSYAQDLSGAYSRVW